MAEYDAMGNNTGVDPAEEQPKPGTPPTTAYVRNPMGPSQRGQTPAAATAAAAAPSPSDMSPAGNQNNLLQMLFLAIAQMLGVNLTSMQQAQAANTQNKPAVVAAAPQVAAPVPTPIAKPSAAPIITADFKIETDEFGNSMESLLIENHALMMYNPFLKNKKS